MSYKAIGCCNITNSADGYKTKLIYDVLRQAEIRAMVAEPLSDDGRIKQLFMWRLFSEKCDNAYIIYLDSRFMCIKTEKISLNGVRLRDSYTDHIIRQCEKLGASYFAAAHSHINEPLVPSPDDIKLTQRLESVWINKKRAFLGHYIVKGTDILKINTQYQN